MITDTTRRQQYDISSSVPATFTFSFWWYTAAEFHAVVTLSTGVVVEIVNGVDYELTAPAEGGTLTRLTDLDADAQTLTLYRETPLTQDVDFRNGDISDAEVHEAAHDRAVAMIQENQDDSSRAFLGPITDPPGLTYDVPAVAARANKYMGFLNDGSPTALDGTGGVETTNALQLGGRLPGHGDEEIPISDDVVNSHLYAGRAVLADEATHAADADTADLATNATNAANAADSALINGYPVLAFWNMATYVDIVAGDYWYPTRGFYFLSPASVGLLMQIVWAYSSPIYSWTGGGPVPGFLASPNSTNNCVRVHNPTGSTIRLWFKKVGT